MSPRNSAEVSSRENQRPLPRPHPAIRLILGAALLVVAAWVGRDFGYVLPEIEKWTDAHGPIGEAVFLLTAVMLTSAFVPVTVLAVAGGALFGLTTGTVLLVVATLLGASVNFGLSRALLRDTVRGWLARNPRMAAIERAVNHEGLRFQFLLRMIPLNPASVSYVLGATNTRFGTFIAACLGMVPALFVEVYVGTVAKHAAELSGSVAAHSNLRIALTLGGLVVSVALLIYATYLARRALREYEETVLPQA